jgi:protein disulfide-isomerase
MALDQTVFNQPGVAGAIQSRFIPVKLNADECPDIARGFGITKVPTDVIISPQGNVVGKIVSPATPSAYVAEVHQLANRQSHGSGANYQQAVAGTPRPGYMNAAYANLSVGTPPGSGGTPPGIPPGNAPGQGQRSNTPGMYPAQAPPAMMANSYRGTMPPNNMNNMAPPAYQQPMGRPQEPDRYAMAEPTSNPNMGAGMAPPQAQNSTVPQSAPKAEPAAMSNPYFQANQANAPPLRNDPSLGSGPAMAAATTNPTSNQAPSGNAGIALPPGVPPMGFEGYCPVTMRKSWQWVSGDPRWGAVHRGRTYLFTNEENRDEFLNKPDYYAPALSGIDPVLAIEQNQMVSGRREHSLEYDNQFFFFSNEATLEQFRRSPERYVDGVRQAMGLTHQASR